MNSLFKARNKMFCFIFTYVGMFIFLSSPMYPLFRNHPDPELCLTSSCFITHGCPPAQQIVHFHLASNFINRHHAACIFRDLPFALNIVFLTFFYAFHIHDKQKVQTFVITVLNDTEYNMVLSFSMLVGFSLYLLRWRCSFSH